MVARLVESGVAVCPTVNARMPELAGLVGRHRLPPVAELADAGVRLLAGTDSGIGQLPHHAYIAGLRAWEWFGVPSDEVLLNATSRAADALGLGGVTGRLAPGLSADLIACAGDPRRGVGALAALRLVLARGRTHSPRPVPALVPFDLQHTSHPDTKEST